MFKRSLCNDRTSKPTRSRCCNCSLDVDADRSGSPASPHAVAGTPGDSVPTNVPLKQAPLWEDVKKIDGDPLFDEALDIIRKEGRASVSMLQRRLRIGYTRASRIVDMMEDKKIVGPPEGGTQMRPVLDYGQTSPPKDDGI